MTLSRIAGTCVVAAIVTAAVSASASYSSGEGQGASPEISALESEGLSPSAARRAIAAQERITQAKAVEKIEAAMGGRFGGAWFDAATARLHVGVTSPAGRRAAQGIVEQEGLGADVVLTEVRSTRAELGAAQKRWDGKLAGLPSISGEYQTAILPQANAVSVRLSSEAPAATLASLEREASSDSVNISIVILPPSRLIVIPAANTTPCNKFKTNEARCAPSITSGVSIGRAGAPVCTAGPLAIPIANKNARTLLTAGHCGVKGEAWNAWNTKGVEGQIGKGEEFNFNLGGDYGEIPIELGGPWSFGGDTPVFAVTAQWLANEESSWPVKGEKKPTTGEVTCHDGQTSGGSCGKILSESVNVKYLVPVPPSHTKVEVDSLVEAQGPSLVIEKGDSGGPFYFIEGATKTVSMEGITSGMQQARNPGIAFFQSLKPVLTKLNLELLTTANEERKVGTGWMVNGTNLTGAKALATTAAVDEEFELTASGAKVNCAGNALNSANPAISGGIGEASALEFTECKGNVICPLGQSTIKTQPVLLELTLDGVLAAKGRLLAPNSSKLLATLKFEGAECSFKGTLPVTGYATVLAPTGQDERTVQQIKVTSEEAGSLKLGSTAATLKGSILIRLASGERFSFL